LSRASDRCSPTAIAYPNRITGIAAMCELFSMSSRYPANISFSLEEFARHGGMSGPHKDGWGIAFYEGGDVRLIREADSAATSPCIEYIRSHKYPSSIVISHLRKATLGAVNLSNTQPFSRELAGRMHVFAHNGDLDNILTNPDMLLSNYHPIGNTDSEFAFCHLMHLLQDIWQRGAAPELKARYQVVSAFAAKIRPLGPSNFIYSDGEYLFVHGHERSQPGKEGLHPPGLFWICRTCTPGHQRVEIPGLELEYEGAEQKAALIASVPLTNEKWHPLDKGEIVVFREGERVPC